MESFFALRLEIAEIPTDHIRIPRRLFANVENEQPFIFDVGERYDYDLKRFGAGKIDLIDAVVDSKNDLIIKQTSMTFQGALRLYRHAPFSERLDSDMMTCDVLEESVIFSYTFPHANCVIIPAIPMAITPHDVVRLLRLVDEGCIGMHLLKDTAPNRYMALLLFVDTKHANEFSRCHDGTPFSWVEPDTCHVLFLSLFQISVNATLTNLPRDGFDMVTSMDTITLNPCSELSTCPLCLDRLDATASGINTSICRHSYKCDCLDRWFTSKCSVCFISSMGSGESKETANIPDIAPPKCADCDSTDNIWVCLICGHCGCGRYRKGHARQHYEYGGHAFVMEVGTQHVWDYAEDMYVHRLLRTGESRTNLVDIGAFVDGENSLKNKFNAQTLEDEDHFSRMFSAQLTSQKEYFMTELERTRNAYEVETSELREAIEMLSSEITNLQNDKTESDKRLGQLQRLFKEAQERSTALKGELEEERAMSAQLIKTRDEYASIIKEKDKEIVNMQEQTSDLIAHMQAQAAMAEMSLKEELREGKIVIQNSSKKQNKTKGTKR